MSDVCECGSHAINRNHHGREHMHLVDLCDVCYWRREATTLTEEMDRLKEVIKEATDMDIKQARWESLGGNTVTLGRSTQLLLAALTPQESDNE